MRFRKIPTLFATVVLCANIQAQEKLIYHQIQTDAQGKIVPWFDPDPSKAYNQMIKLVWGFWDHMRQDQNGLPYYMNHQVWNANFNDPRGLGGDQLGMALSSWRLYYAYSGDERVKANMCFIADYYLTHGFSPPNAEWPNLPFPYNTLVYSGLYDGDMRAGKDFTQPDKAGSLGLELIHLYKMSAGFNVSENPQYLQAAVRIADTLAQKMKKGDAEHSPWPFRVNAYTGKIAPLDANAGDEEWRRWAQYTSNWSATMQLFLDLIEMKQGDVGAYKKSFEELLAWMKAYPLKDNRWGPFFEDVGSWSDTQINAMTFARFIMEHREYFSDWKADVLSIIDWVHTNFANDKWKKYGVKVTNEQTVYRVPGESHSSRQAADELLYVRLSGDTNLYENAVRELNWATYAVDADGKTQYPNDEVWLTDGYGDFMRHYLRAMDAAPELAPGDEDHILSSTAVVGQADYQGGLNKFYGLNFENVEPDKVVMFYRTYEQSGTERIRLRSKPAAILLDYKSMPERASGEGFEWQPLKKGGLLTVRREKGSKVLLVR